MLELPLYPTLESARLAAARCRGCRRHLERTQVVFGHGNSRARLMLVGESPSATDDNTGLPFTGPAGRLLDDLLAELSLHRRDLWLTNLVRCHAGVERNGRVENRPARVDELRTCATWLDIEIRYVDPKVIVAVGASAAKHIIDTNFRLKEQRGQLHDLSGGRLAIATVQPAYVMRLRNINPGSEVQARALLLDDLRLAASLAGLLG